MLRFLAYLFLRIYLRDATKEALAMQTRVLVLAGSKPHWWLQRLNIGMGALIMLRKYVHNLSAISVMTGAEYERLKAAQALADDFAKSNPEIH